MILVGSKGRKKQKLNVLSEPESVSGNSIQSDVYAIEKFLKIRRNRNTGTVELLVHWEGYGVADRTWEPLFELRLESGELVENFKEAHPKEWNDIFFPK